MSITPSQAAATPPHTATAEAAGSPDRAHRYMRRVDEHLASLLTRRDRCIFLHETIEAWELAYARFQAAGLDEEPWATHQPSAWDYRATLDGLHSRLALHRDRV
jgi:hypothetical protein